MKTFLYENFSPGFESKAVLLDTTQNVKMITYAVFEWYPHFAAWTHSNNLIPRLSCV